MPSHPDRWDDDFNNVQLDDLIDDESTVGWWTSPNDTAALVERPRRREDRAVGHVASRLP